MSLVHSSEPAGNPSSAVLERPEMATGRIVEAADLFKALGNPIRLQLVALVRQSRDREACFCDLAGVFDIPKSSLSHHLKILVDTGILARERRGTWTWYRIQHEPLDDLEELVKAGGPLRADLPTRDSDECG